jgi:hypothetical protein
MTDIEQTNPDYIFEMREGENLQQYAKRIEAENIELRKRLEKEYVRNDKAISEIDILTKENKAMKSTIDGLTAINKTHVLTIADQNDIIDRLQCRVLELNQPVGKPETTEQASLLHRLFNRFK